MNLNANVDSANLQLVDAPFSTFNYVHGDQTNITADPTARSEPLIGFVKKLSLVHCMTQHTAHHLAFPEPRTKL
jgi:hypothetical protein